MFSYSAVLTDNLVYLYFARTVKNTGEIVVLFRKPVFSLERL
jgi:hypothetical protein